MCLFYCSLIFISHSFLFFFFQSVFDRAVRCGIVREGVVVSTAEGFRSFVASSRVAGGLARPITGNTALRKTLLYLLPVRIH